MIIIIEKAEDMSRLADKAHKKSHRWIHSNDGSTSQRTYKVSKGVQETV